MYKLKVRTSTEYDITITDSLELFSEKVLPLIKGEKVAIITDEKVNSLYGDCLYELLQNKNVINVVIKSGEKSKNAKNYIGIINTLAESGFTREDTVIALGGGVVGDLAGFVASTYMRGITLIAMPTTLLSAVDSSVGGKTAIDLKSGKNLCGTFYQPKAVYINTEFLKTLPKKEVQNGLGEVIKYAFLSHTVSEQDIKKINEKLIYKCLKIKCDIVEKDEKESGKRALLNLGHTFGHAIENLSGYKIPHGTCVAKGLVFSIEISKRLFGLSSDKISEIYKLLKCSKHNLICKYTVDALVSQITSDKKRTGGKIKFITLKDIGEPIISTIEIDKLKGLLKDYEY